VRGVWEFLGEINFEEFHYFIDAYFKGNTG